MVVANGQRLLAQRAPGPHNAAMRLLRHRLDLNEPKSPLDCRVPSPERFGRIPLRGKHARRRKSEVRAPLICPGAEATCAMTDVEVYEKVAGVGWQSRLGRI